MRDPSEGNRPNVPLGAAAIVHSEADGDQVLSLLDNCPARPLAGRSEHNLPQRFVNSTQNRDRNYPPGMRFAMDKA
jgi:hypothetical protein